MKINGAKRILEKSILQKLAADPGTLDRIAITEADETAVTAVISINSFVVFV